MKPETFEESVDKILGELRSLLLRKHKQYGPKNVLVFGKMGVMVRMSDKMNRIINLWEKRKEPEDEPLIDSYKDIACYAIIWLLLHDEIFNLPLKEEVK